MGAGEAYCYQSFSEDRPLTYIHNLKDLQKGKSLYLYF